MDQYGYIRTAHRVYKKSVEQICRETGHSRETVRKPNRNISTCPFAIFPPEPTTLVFLHKTAPSDPKTHPRHIPCGYPSGRG